MAPIRFPTILVLSVVLISATLPSRVDATPTIASQPRIVGGDHPKPGNPGLTSSVVLTHSMNHYVFCSGVLVAENLVLTAAHCLIPFDDPDNIYIHFVDYLWEMDWDNTRYVTEMLKHGDYDSPNNDIAWLKFHGPVPDGYRPATIYKDESVLVQGLGLTLVGYGATVDDGSAVGYRLTVDTKVRTYLNNDEYKGLIIFGPTPGKSACYGDSGGPAYAKINGQWVLVGVTTGPDEIIAGTTSCSAGNGIYNSTAYHAQWISETSGVEINMTD